jgi:hypothetical protein
LKHRQAQTRDAQARRPSAKRGRLAGGAVSVLAHASIVLALFSRQAVPPSDRSRPFEETPVIVTLVHEPRLPPKPLPAAKPAPTPAPAEPAPAKAAPEKPTPPKPLPPRHMAKPRKGSPDIDPLPAEDMPTVDPGPELSEAQLAGATVAGSGSGAGAGAGGGGVCDMARLLQTALRRDPLVRTAVAGSAGKAIMVWNGDWVQGRGEDGKGLAAVREAIMWEVAFAPKACRSQPVRGLVLISLNDTPGAVRLAVGSGVWRWTDLLTPRRAAP